MSTHITQQQQQHSLVSRLPVHHSSTQPQARSHTWTPATHVDQLLEHPVSLSDLSDAVSALIHSVSAIISGSAALSIAIAELSHYLSFHCRRHRLHARGRGRAGGRSRHALETLETETRKTPIIRHRASAISLSLLSIPFAVLHRAVMIAIPFARCVLHHVPSRATAWLSRLLRFRLIAVLMDASPTSQVIVAIPFASSPPRLYCCLVCCCMIIASAIAIDHRHHRAALPVSSQSLPSPHVPSDDLATSLNATAIARSLTSASATAIAVAVF